MDAGERILNSKRPVEANKNDTEGIDAHNNTRRISEGGTTCNRNNHAPVYTHHRRISLSRSWAHFDLRSIQRARDCPGSFEGVAHGVAHREAESAESPGLRAEMGGTVTREACVRTGVVDYRIADHTGMARG